MQPKLTFHCWSFSLHLPSSRIKGLYHCGLPHQKKQAKRQVQQVYKNTIKSVLCWPTTSEHQGLHWSVVNIPSDTPLAKTNFSPCWWLSVAITFWLEVIAHVHSFLSVLGLHLTWTCLRRPCAFCHCLWIMCASVLLYLESSITSGSYNCSASSFAQIPES